MGTDAITVASFIERGREAWLEATEHASFIRGVRDGSLDPDSFDRWLVRDRLFVDGLYGAQARVLPLAEGDTRRALLDGLVALQAELDWFEEHAAKRSLALVTSPVDDCLEYVDYLHTMAFAPRAVAFTAIWAVERAYLDAWCAARPGAPEYVEFVEHWAHDGFARYVDRLRAGADEALARASDDDREAAYRAFRRVVGFERRFWEVTHTA